MKRQHIMYAIPNVLNDRLDELRHGASNAQNVTTPPIIIAIVLNARDVFQ